MGETIDIQVGYLGNLAEVGQTLDFIVLISCETEQLGLKGRRRKNVKNRRPKKVNMTPLNLVVVVN